MGQNNLIEDNPEIIRKKNFLNYDLTESNNKFI